MVSRAPKTGPTAKKDPDARLGHRSAEEQDRTDTINPESLLLPTVSVPPGLEPPAGWHPAALAFWHAYLESPLRLYYEATDVATAWYTCELISNSIKSGTPAGQSQHIRMYLNDLGATEAARRSMDIKIKRETEAADPKKVASMARARALREGRTPGSA